MLILWSESVKGKTFLTVISQNENINLQNNLCADKTIEKGKIGKCT